MKTFFATDVGQHQIWASQYLKLDDKRCFIVSGGLGTMGFGLPSAIGAKIANKKNNVFLITGDGSFTMTMHEMATIKRYKIPVKIIVLNNSRLGMVKQWQELFYKKNYSETNLEGGNPDFVKNAKSFGIKAKKITKVKDVKKALTKMINSKNAYLLEICVDSNENVYPMIPVGKGHNEIMLNQDC
jgi:acetolactate synthase-1/2/3 large subunit